MGLYKPGIDVVVVNYRTPTDLARFCESFDKHRPTVEHSIRIFNADPTNADLTVAQQWSDLLEAKHISDKNVGYARAVNTCVKRGEHDVIAIFNADVQITKGSLDSCRQALVDNVGWGVLGPRQIDEKGLITHGGILDRQGTHRGWHVRSDDYQDVVDDVPTIMGAAVFMKRACWDELSTCAFYRDHVREAFGTLNYGAFLPTFLYYEETFCCYHAIEHGWKVVYYGPVTMIHGWHHSISTQLSQGSEQSVIEQSRQQFEAACDAVHGIRYG